ncbi:MAG: leucine-rich repeat domain-containing protein [Planctomycetes bacterium]|nr:leucine-rich repeat domain-containing protein [Planctomycetota bacterium]
MLTTILCVWIGLEATQARQQRASVAWVISNGGKVTYDFEFSDFDQQYLAVHPEAPGPDWLVKLVGVDFFATVVDVDIVDAHVHDLSALKALSNLKSLYLKGTHVDNMSTLAELSALRILFLREVHLRDLSILADLTNLKELWLDTVPAADLSPLARLRQLKYVSLFDVPVTETEVERLREALPECEIDGPSFPKTPSGCAGRAKFGCRIVGHLRPGCPGYECKFHDRRGSKQERCAAEDGHK